MATQPDSFLRVMVDANVLIAGVVWPRWPYEVLRHAVRGDFQLTLSHYVISQAERRFSQRFPDFLDRFTETMQSIQYEMAAEPARESLIEHQNLMRDPTDLTIALAAINSKVDFLVTRDRDFTDRNETTEELHKRLKILLPGTFLREHMGWASEELEAIRHRRWQDL
jgi:putative PIN family toxin of toxin-antitoxin system